MVETVNTLNELGKCFYIEPTEENGFKEVRLPEKTHISPRPFKVYHTPDKQKYFDAKVYRVHIGKDYRGPLELPKGTETVEIYDLEDGRQVIFYARKHFFPELEQMYAEEEKKGKKEGRPSLFPPPELRAFANEFRSKDNRVEVEDLLTKN